MLTSKFQMRACETHSRLCLALANLVHLLEDVQDRTGAPCLGITRVIAVRAVFRNRQLDFNLR